MNNKRVKEFMSLLFFARDAAHREHLKTRVFAQHMALGEFYHAIIDLADKFAETYQGEYDLIGDFELSNDKVSDIVKELQAQVAWIERYRDDICEKDNSPLQNNIDEIVGQYRASLYKLRFLK